MWIMIAGPYTSGTNRPEERARNLARLHDAARAVRRLGHLPVIGVDLALPLVADEQTVSGDRLMPMSLELARRCDAVLRIGGPSAGADREVELFRERERPVFHAIADIPQADTDLAGLGLGTSLEETQRYIARMEEVRGFAGQSVADKCLLLGEEVGELFKAVRRQTAVLTDPASRVYEVEDELADVLIYVAAIANRMGVDLERALRRKEAKNAERRWQ